MPIWLSALIVALPTYLYARLVRSIDRFEQEPARYVIAAFVWGAVPAAFLALIAQLVLVVPTQALIGEDGTNVVAAAVYAPITEELIKGLAVWLIYLLRRREFDGWVDGIVYGSTVGFGFAYVENIIYLASAATFGQWLELFVLRVIVFGFMHGFYTSLIGIGFGVARHAAIPACGWAAIVLGFGAAILTHAVHNASIVFAEASGLATLSIAFLNYALLIVLMIGLRRISKRNERNMLRTYLLDEVPGVISAQAYAALVDGAAGAVPKPRARFYHLVGELAQRKRQILKYGEPAGGLNAEIDRLRAQLREMFDPLRQT